MIPEILKNYTQWVCWKYMDVNGRKTKVPISPVTGKTAATNNPDTWSTYQEAKIASILYNGIGFVFTESDPFVGIDIDHCIHPKGRIDDMHKNGWIDKEAYELIKLGGSYCEKSPSGTGLHIIGTGTLRDGIKGRRHGNIEIYEASRYFTVTEQPILKEKVNDIQLLIDFLMEFKMDSCDLSKTAPVSVTAEDTVKKSKDIALIKQLFKQKNGDTIRRLYNGEDVREGDKSVSDLVFCKLVNFRTKNNLAQTDRIFRMSKRMRPKWDTVHFSTGETYGERTLKRSCVAVVYKGKGEGE